MLIQGHLEAYFSKDPAQEVVVSCEGLSHKHLCSGVGIQQTLVGGLEEALVGIEAWLEQLVKELTKDATAIDACLVQAVSIEKVDSDLFL